MTRILSRADVEGLLQMREVVDWMAEAFVALSAGKAKVPVRTLLGQPGSNDGLLVMPAWMPGTESANGPPPDASTGRYTVKLVSLCEDNPLKDLPFARATVLVMDSSNGALLAVIEGESLTAVRTGAGSGLATELMSRADSSTVVVVGAGRQATAQLEAVCAVRPIKKAWVISRTAVTGRNLADSLTRKLGVDVDWADRRDVASTVILRGADIICTATNSVHPVLSVEDVSPGTHINGVGSHRSDMAELPGDLVARSRVIVDQREACLQEAGDILQPIKSGLITDAHIAGELGDVVSRTVHGRTSAEEITFFKSVGNGVQDLVVACKLVEKAAASGTGLLVEMG